jgi:hypothetical protein
MFLVGDFPVKIRYIFLFLTFVALIPLLGPSTAFTQGKKGSGKKGDPTARFFDTLSEGKNSIDLTNLPGRWQRWGDRFADTAKQMGLNPRNINRQDFLQLMEGMRRQSEKNGGGQRGSPRDRSSGPSGPDRRSEAFDDERAKNAFQRMDRNGDGVISPSEASETLKAEFEKWDANRNGVIDFEEFKAYFKARMNYLRGDPADRRGGSDYYPGGVPDQPEEDVRPTVYHSGNLPKDLLQVAPWFAQLDLDKDGQVALYEWKQAGYSVDEFVKWDANGDGLITVEEALRYIRANKLLPTGQGGTPTPGAEGSTPASPQVPGPGNNVRGPGRGQGGPGGPGRGQGRGPGRGQGRGPGGPGGPGGPNGQRPPRGN